MRIRQYAYLAVYSESIPADELESRIGVKADSLEFAGEELENGLPRKLNAWRIFDADAGQRVDTQFSELLSRIDRSRPAIQKLVSDEAAEVVLQSVRYFNHGEGEEEQAEVRDGLEKLPGQHQLLGWHIGKTVLEFIAETNAELDCDEFDWAELPADFRGFWPMSDS